METRDGNLLLKNLLFWIALIVIGVVIWNLSARFGPGDNTIMFSEFMNRVDSGQVAKVTIAGKEIRGTTKTGTETFRTYSPTYDNLVPRLLEKGVQVDVKPGGAGTWTALLASWFPLAILGAAFPVAIFTVTLAMLRRLRSIDDKLDRLLSAGGGPGRR